MNPFQSESVLLAKYKNLMVLLFCIISVCSEVFADASFESLVAKLKSAERSERASATAELLQGGHETLRSLEEHIAQDSDFSYQLQKIANKIRQRIARESLDGTLVTLGRPNDFTLQYAVEALSRQSKLNVNVAERDKPIRLQFDQQSIPFWQGIDLIAKQADIGWGIQDREVIFDSDYRVRHAGVSYPKSLRVAATHSRQSRGFKTRADRGVIRINFRVDIEPHITPYFMTVQDQNFELVAQTKNGPVVIAPFNRDSVREISGGDQSGFEFYVDFKSDEKISSKEFQLTGAVTVLCAAQENEFVLPLVAGEQDENEVLILDYQKIDDKVRVLTKVQLPQELAGLDSHRIAMLHKDVWLRSHAGQRHRPVSVRVSKAVGRTHQVEFLFREIDEETQELEFICSYPLYVSSLVADFEIDRIPGSITP